jgi:acetylornithine deacetylase/succinyl-diaminopimelate desuccinylase-like protein
MLATLYDEQGNVTIDGLDNTGTWSGVEYPTDKFRTDARVLDGVDLAGDGDISSMLWSRTSVSILGIDCPSVEAASNSVQSQASALVSMRIPPGVNSKTAQDALMAHLEAAAPWNVQLKLTPGDPGMPFEAVTTGPAYSAMQEAMEEAYGCAVTTAGQGGSLPLANTLHDACPSAEIMLIGVEEPACLIHAPNESVDAKELERHTLSEALFFEKFAANWKQSGS